ncbi:cell division protein FtsA [Perlucidibaca aquatica]|jgi:cell division protein FtsA|uniref:cell division protein FtsA n=1 Tax=Perlucidibaca aquatica TaxID=1852776 RepID=UPI00083A9755
MANMTQAPMIVALDIGTSKVVCMVAQINQAEQSLEIVGYGMKPSKGMRKGVVVNIDQMQEAIQSAVAEAELMADCRIHSAYIGIAGSHIGGRNSQAVVAIRDGEVTQTDIERVIDAAKSGANPADQRILHVLPQEFIVDDQGDVRNPLGMAGVRLEGHIHLVTCSANAAQNLEKCVRGAGLAIDDIVLEQVASSHGVLTDDEKDLGVCLVDIGGGTTDIAVFVRGAIRHTAVIPIAGDQVTNDIAMALRTPTPAADEIKVRYACVVPQMVDPEQTISVPGMGDRPARTLARQTLSAVVEPRYEELFSIVQMELERCGYADQLAAGVVMTGGSAKIEGAVQLAESIFHLPVRIGMPKSLKLGGMEELLHNPIYATGIGLLFYGMQRTLASGLTGSNRVQRREDEGASFIGKMKGWFASNF